MDAKDSVEFPEYGGAHAGNPPESRTVMENRYDVVTLTMIFAVTQRANQIVAVPATSTAIATSHEGLVEQPCPKTMKRVVSEQLNLGIALNEVESAAAPRVSRLK